MREYGGRPSEYEVERWDAALGLGGDVPSMLQEQQDAVGGLVQRSHVQGRVAGVGWRGVGDGE